MKRFIVLVSILWCTMPAFSNGTILEGEIIKSKILKSEMLYSIYLPDGYEQSTRRYPVLYLLHGLNGSYSGWVQQGDVGRIADAAIASGQAPEMIIVMPDAKNTWYINDYKGVYRYEDYFIQEFIPHIDKTYRTRDIKKYRAISGLSMGGHGSLLYALKYPDLFSRCYAMSPAVYTNNFISQIPIKRIKRSTYDVIYGWDSIPGNQRLTQHYLENSPINIIVKMPKERLEDVQFYIDCGDDDSLIGGNFALVKEMRERKMKLEFRMRDGAHLWKYWREALPVTMQFVGESFMSNR